MQPPSGLEIMEIDNFSSYQKTRTGFTLPAILVVVAALLILAVGILLVVGIERGTSRSFVDREKAELAARAGLEEVKGVFQREAANDDFLIIQATAERDANSTFQKELPPYLYIARGKGGGDRVSFRYLPLFSSKTSPTSGNESEPLAAPKPEDIVGTLPKNFSALLWYDQVGVSWISIQNEKNKTVSRYAYWIEDLQSRVDAATAGNTKDDGAHKRYGWTLGDTSKYAKFPAPGLNPEESKPDINGRDAEPPLNAVALYALDPFVGVKDDSSLDKTIMKSRKILVSPNSTLAAAGIESPQIRGADGHLTDAKSRAVEENLTASVQPYDEQPIVPFANGIDSGVTGQPKLNLNALLAKPPADAVDEMAAWIGRGLPKFEARKGLDAFPQNYLKTIAANAIDYADADKDATVSAIPFTPNSYRGLDAYPLLSEIILHTKYLGIANLKNRKVMLWQKILFVELWNHTNQKVIGTASVTYENKLRPSAIGAGVTGLYFDSDELINDPAQVHVVPPLTKIDGRFWTGPIRLPGESEVDLEPNQYQFYRAVTVNYFIDVGPSSMYINGNTPFEIYEQLPGSSGISMKWNGRIVDRSDKLLRGRVQNSDFDFTIGTKKQIGQAQIPGHSYGVINSLFKDAMGDSRQSIYLLGDNLFPLSNNLYPGNISPNRRNIRNVTIYKNGKGSSLVYGRVQPSDWPDGGHDTEVPASALPILQASETDYDPANLAIYPEVTNAREGEAPTYLSNRGRFYSATELGRLYDPIMFEPKYKKTEDTKSILNGSIPTGQVSWPSVEVGSTPSQYFGGGNTLRIGRPEHPLFDKPSKHVPASMPGDHAARLLDLFHAGKSRSASATDRQGPLVRIEGHINVNTASRDTLRAMVSGVLVSDPRLVKRISEIHDLSTMAAPVQPLEVSVPTKDKQGDILADAIIRGRPYSSPSEMASALTEDGDVVFGNRDLLPDGNKVQWSDAAAEEAFGRAYESATVRSRNFRVWVIGQSITPTQASDTIPEVLAEVRKVYTVFADPGERNPSGEIDLTKFKIKTISENDF